MTVPDETYRRETPPAPGLQRAGARLPIDEYSRRLWERRYFIRAYSAASGSVGYEGKFLGQIWQVLTPLLNIGVYYLIFGVLLKTNRGIPNYIAYLSVGVFIFAFCTSSMTSGSRAITGNLGLVRALQFPRAVLPMSTTLVALRRLLVSLTVLVPILVLSGEPVTWHWLLLAPAITLQAMFCLGLAFVVARLGALVPDMTEVLPFVARMWMYFSGVMYSLQAFTAGHGGLLTSIVTVNPAYVYLQLSRNALLVSNPVSFSTWVLGAAWAGVAVVMAYLYFWRGEEEYGNV